MNVTADMRLKARTRVCFPPLFDPTQATIKKRNKEMGMYTKVNSFAFKIVFVLLSFCFLCETVIRPKDDFKVCGKKSQNIPFRSSASYFYDLEACFGFNLIDVKPGDICEAKGVEELYKNTEAPGRPSITLVLPTTFLFSGKQLTTVYA